MKKLLKVMIMIGSMLAITITGYAKTETITLENKKVSLDVQEQNGRKFYPLRALCKELEINITSIDEGCIVLEKDGNRVTIERDGTFVSNDYGYFISDAKILEINDMVYVPVKMMGYMFGYNIDVSETIALKKVQNFIIPKPSYGSQLLANDYSCIAKMGMITTFEFFHDHLKDVIENSNYIIVSPCREYIMERQSRWEELSEGLTSQSGKRLYVAGYDLLDKYYNAFYNLDMGNYSSVRGNIDDIYKAVKNYNNIREIFLKEFRKNTIHIK